MTDDARVASPFTMVGDHAAVCEGDVCEIVDHGAAAGDAAARP